MRVDRQRLAKIADFICKTNLKSVPAVVHILHHLGRLDIRPDQRRIELCIE